MSELVLNPLDNWYKKLRSLEKRDNLTKLCISIGRSEETFYGWMRGKSQPSIGDKMAINYFLDKRIFKEVPFISKKK